MLGVGTFLSITHIHLLWSYGLMVEDPIEHRRSREASFEEKPAFDFSQWELSNADSIV